MRGRIECLRQGRQASCTIQSIEWKAKWESFELCRPKEDFSVGHGSPLPARGPKGPYKNRWCEFHRVQGHDTEECWDLMNQIERANTGEKQNDPPEENIRGTVATIAGGFIGGGTTSSAHRRYARSVMQISSEPR
ncbi:hypothetical protein SESBI_43057 [Sesbania bispinosa]|nr:hypothetical protein SESBI_43057 [Sesbania bispinosa]